MCLGALRLCWLVLQHPPATPAWGVGDTGNPVPLNTPQNKLLGTWRVQGSTFWGVVSSMRKLAAGKNSHSAASEIGNQLVPALLNQHFQRKAVLSEDFPPDLMSSTLYGSRV